MILFKTEAGQRAIKDRSVIVTPRQRSAFILFDGKRSMDEVVAAGLGVTREDVEQMVALGLLVPADGTAPVVQTAAAPSPVASPAARPRSSVRWMASTPICPTGAAMDRPMSSDCQK